MGSEPGSVPVAQQHSCFVACRIFISVDVRAGRDPVCLRCWAAFAGLPVRRAGFICPEAMGRGNVQQIYKAFPSAVPHKDTMFVVY